MSDPYDTPEDETPFGTPKWAAGQTRVLQIITLALVAGATVFLGISLVVTRGVMVRDPDFLAWFGMGLGFVQLVLSFVIPSAALKSAASRISAEQLREEPEEAQWNALFPAIQTAHIIGCALLEGGAFLNAVLYIVGRSAASLATASVLIAVLALKFPSYPRIRAKIASLIEDNQTF